MTDAYITRLIELHGNPLIQVCQSMAW